MAWICLILWGVHGAPGWARTPSLQIRSLLLYPISLRARPGATVTEPIRHDHGRGHFLSAPAIDADVYAEEVHWNPRVMAGGTHVS